MRQRTKKLRVLVAYNQPISEDTEEDLDHISEQGVVEEALAVQQALEKRGHETFLLAISNLEDDLFAIRKFAPEVIFNLCEGFRGQARLEMSMAALWELLGIPYTGNRPLTLGISQDKVLTKRLLEAYKINTPPFQIFHRVPRDTFLDFPLIAKPAHEDASLGITQSSVIKSLKELPEVVGRLLKKYKQPVLVEKYIAGREFNISILGNNPARVLPISEVSFETVGKEYHPIVSYEAKWLKEHPLYQQTPVICPAELSPELKDRLEDTALRVYHLLHGRGYGRVDIRVDRKERIYVLEFNPNPDISPDAGFAKALAAAHIKYEDFIEQLVFQAYHESNDGEN